MVRIKIGEGLVGVTLEKLAPVKEGFASRHPGFNLLKISSKARPKFCNT
ncbi:hypothetical protein N9893_01210 [bacterium]|nr:hypothetical protein [bacterium]